MRSLTQKQIAQAEAYVLKWGVEYDPGSWIFGSHIDHEGRHMAPLVDAYFTVACPRIGVGQRQGHRTPR